MHAPRVVQVRGQDAVGREGGAGVEGRELLAPRVELGGHAGVACSVRCRRHHLGHRLQQRRKTDSVLCHALHGCAAACSVMSGNAAILARQV